MRVLGGSEQKGQTETLTITDETSDTGETITAKEETETSGSLRAEAGWFGGAAIGGNIGQATDNITIKGYATVKANTLGSDGAGIGGGNGAKGSNITIQGHANVTANGGWSGAGIGGGGRGAGEDGCGGDAENITIQDYAKVTATAHDGAAIGSGSPRNSLLYTQEKSGDATNIVIRGHAIVNAKNDGKGAAIGAAGDGKDASAEVTIGTAGATAETGRCPYHGNRVLRLCHWQWRKRYQGHHSGPCDHPDGERRSVIRQRSEVAWEMWTVNIKDNAYH